MENLTEYLCAMHMVRSYDYSIMDCLTANRKGPTLPVGGVSYQPNMDQKTDYIITSAMMASLDLVALDTAEASLAGYEQTSIPILSMAGDKGLGQSSPAYIHIEGGKLFSTHRHFLWDIHRKDCPPRYPLEDGWGGAKALKTAEPKYSVTAGKPKKISDNVYEINYSVITKQMPCNRKIVRVEVMVSGTVFDFKTGDYLEEGCFTLDLRQHLELHDTDFAYTIFVWDDTFNCEASIERFILTHE
ncbi:MAG: hypothetical protein FWD03_00655 [Defluviitaleaceae bacterium]|nr:hypothetical protein [Defluviitaleaceae bacterium]